MTAATRSARPEIVAGALETAAAEMCACLIKSAYSPNIKERADCSTALADPQGRILSIATHAPAHLGSVVRIVPAVLERFPLDRIAPGDVFFGNDPYLLGVTHLNDCTVVAPIFAVGRPIAFAIAVAHHSDVGGRVPGSESGDSTSIFQEGVRFPPVRLVERGVRRGDLWELFLLNSRTPHFGDGDLSAQLAALERGRVRIEELYARYGTETTQATIEQVLDATEQRLRGRIRSRNLTAIVLADILFRALGQAAPARAIAASGAFHGTILSGWDARRRRYFVNYENFAGGAGALPTRDGDDATHISMTNTSNLPIEAMEAEFPLRVERYELIPDSGGAGRHRGGLGICREIRILADGITLATRSARQRFAAPGLDGGDAGGVGSFSLDRATPDETRLPGTGSEIPLRAGDLLRIETAGGGGYGKPRTREEPRIAADRRAGKVSEDAAREIYR